MSQLDFITEAVSDWTRLYPDGDLRSLGIIQRLVWTGRLAENLLERVAVASGFRRRGDYEVLALMRRVEPALLTPLELADQLLTSQSGMTGKLDRLEDMGYLERTPDPEDRRTVKLVLTDPGRTLIDKAFAASLGLYDAMVDGLTPTEKKELETLLEGLLMRFEAISARRQPWRDT